MDLPGRGRRDRLHRVRLAKKSERVPGRLVVRRIPDFNAEKQQGSRPGHPVRPVALPRVLHHRRPQVLDTVAADKTHRHHAVIEQVHADLKSSALAHLPSGVFTANAAWLVLAVIAFNLTRAAASLTDPGLAKATTATIRRKLIRCQPGSRPQPAGSPCTSQSLALGGRLDRAVRPGQRPATSPRGLTTQQHRCATEDTSGTPGHRGPADPRARRPHTTTETINSSRPAHRWIRA